MHFKKTTFQPDNDEDIVDNNKFLRIGFIVHTVIASTLPDDKLLVVKIRKYPNNL